MFKKNTNCDDNLNQPYINEQDMPYVEENIPKKRKTIFKKKKAKPNFFVSVFINVIRISVVLILAIGIALVGIVVGIGKAYVETAPNLDINLINNQAKTSFIYDCNGKLLTDYKGIENRVKVGIDYIPKNLQNAFVAVEDARFFNHNGVDVRRIVGAFVNNFLKDSTQGGSTITQQLIKNTVLSNEISYKRKIQEAYLALQLEQKYSKQQILEAYLNTIYLGENYYGVKVAAQGYFGKDLHTLTLRECAMLAGITSNPYYYNPHKNYFLRNNEEKNYKKITNDRTNYVLRQMLENRFITKEEYNNALAENTASVVEKPTKAMTYKHAHYIEYAIEDAISILIKQNNLENTSANRQLMENKIRTGGYHIKLAMDAQIQDIVEETLENYAKYPQTADKNDGIMRLKNSDGTFEEILQPQAAAVVLDYRTGELKAIVGSRTRPKQLKTLNRAYQMNMPVGSSIKPLSVFAPAIDTGASAASVVFNMPVPIEGWLNDQKQNSFPKNYGGGSYTGFETMREALRKSHNTSTASAFSMYVGVDKSVDYLKRLGISPKNINPTPFGLALGSSGITPIQMTVAYGVFGNAGVYQEPLSILGISDSNGQVIYDGHQSQAKHEAVKPSTAWLIVDMLKDATNTGTGVNAKIKGQTVAGKTGTNSEHRGVTFSGLTGYYASSIWVGHDNYKPLSSKATGGGVAGAIWQSYMRAIHEQKQLPNQDILAGDPTDYGLVKQTTCPISGQLVTEECYHDASGKAVITDWWPADAVPTVSCQMHHSITICTQSHLPATQFCPPKTQQTVSGIVIPEGHPLYIYKGTIYENVIREYAGEAVVFGNDGMQHFCDVHNEYTSATAQTTQEQNIYGQANDLLVQAKVILEQNRTNPSAVALEIAINNLQSVLNTTQDTTIIYNYMVELTNVLTNFY